jgi:hypothetical protein
MSKWNDQAGRLREGVVDFLWDQWIALGVAGRGAGAPVPFVVDPEALVLATMRFGGGEARLVEEVLDWLARNGGLISLQRLKNLQTSSRVGTREGLEGLGRFMEEAGYRNWKTLPAWAEKVSSRSGHAWIPKDLVRREMSAVPECRRPEAFLLRLRALFGVSARPEVIAWLLIEGDGYAAEIARETGWFSKSVQAILNDLELSGLLVSEPVGKRKMYSMNARSETFHPRLGFGLRWLSQAPLYLGVFQAMETLGRLAATPEASEGAQAISIRRNVPALNAAFRLAGTGDPFKGASSLAGGDLVQCFEKGVVRLSTGIAERAFG